MLRQTSRKILLAGGPYIIDIGDIRKQILAKKLFPLLQDFHACMCHIFYEALWIFRSKPTLVCVDSSQQMVEEVEIRGNPALSV